MRKRVLVWVACFSMATSWAAPPPLTLFASENYRPISWIDEQGQARGLALEAIEFVQKDTGIKIHVELLPWNRAYNLAVQGRGGVIGLSYTPERAALFDDSASIYDSGTTLVVHKNRPLTFKTLADLKGKKIGALMGVSYGSEIDQAARNGLFEFVRDTSHVARLKNVLAGRVDAALIANAKTDLGAILAADPQLQARAAEFVVLDQSLGKDPIHVGFRKGSLDAATRSKLFQSFEKWRKQHNAR